MPHRTFAQVAKRRLIGKEGRERIREVRALLAELPDYKNGPYADLRKSLLAEIEDTRVRSNAVHRDSIAVRREGAAQIALVGPPNVGKSSLLQALSRDPDQDRRLPVHDAAARPGADADRRRARPARGDPGADRGRDARTAVADGRCSASCAPPTRSSTALGRTPTRPSWRSSSREVAVAGIEKPVVPRRDAGGRGRGRRHRPAGAAFPSTAGRACRSSTRRPWRRSGTPRGR